jgi:hypothetical protein
VPGRWLPRHRPLMVSNAGALTQPDRARPEHAAQLARAGRVAAIARPEREVLVVAGQVVRRPAAAVVRHSGRTELGPGGAAGARTAGRGERVREPEAWRREPVVWVWPRHSLGRVEPGRADSLGEPRKLVAATLTDGGERD